ncbi:hypothetical protein Hanom_Chr17g01585531 [Helianthus anomalus]
MTPVIMLQCFSNQVHQWQRQVIITIFSASQLGLHLISHRAVISVKFLAKHLCDMLRTF